MAEKNPATIDEYINSCDPSVQKVLFEIRDFIKQHATDATEKISWNMPTFYYKENLVHFCAHKNHIGFYPTPSGIEAFVQQFKKLGYKFSKGAVQFPINKPMPFELIGQIVDFRVNEVNNKLK